MKKIILKLLLMFVVLFGIEMSSMATPFGTNIVINGDASTGSITGWTASGPSASSFLVCDSYFGENVQTYHGRVLEIYDSSPNLDATFSQTINVSDIQSLISAGQVSLEFSAQAFSWFGATASYTVEELDITNNVISTHTSGSLILSAQSDNYHTTDSSACTWTTTAISVANLNSNTVKLKISVNGKTSTASEDFVDFDNISLILSASPTVTTTAATTIDANSATLNGTVNANNTSSVVTFEYGTTTAYGSSVTAIQSPVTGASATLVSAVLTALVPNTTYYYRVIGVNTAGTSNGSQLSFTTSAIAPTVTTGAASSVTSTGASLNGTVNANNATSVVTFEYGTTTAYGSSVTAMQSPVTGTSATSVSAVLTALVPNTTYYYRVIGVNTAGTSNGSQLSFTTSAIAPTVTTGSASSVTSTGASLNGSVNANNASSVVTFEYGKTTAYGSSVTAAQSPVMGTSNTSVNATVSGLTPGTTYHYRVKATNGAGTTYGLDQILITVPLMLNVSTPTASISKTGDSGSIVNVSSNTIWTAVSDQAWLSPSPSVPTFRDAVLVFTASVNPTVSARIAIVTLTASGVSPVTVTVTQAAGDATSSISASSINAVKTGGVSTVDITSNTSWSAASDQTWAVVSQDVSEGNGILTLTTSANPTVSSRTATITITVTGGVNKTIIVTQAAGDASCTIATSTADFTKSAGNTSVNVTCNTSWTVSSDQTWLTVTPSTPTTGDDVVGITVTENTGVARTATVTIAVDGGITKTITVTQASGVTTGIVESEKFKPTINPNPASNEIRISGIEGHVIVIISDLSGKEIIRTSVADNSPIAVESLVKGTYLAKIIMSNKTEVVKFIKK